MKVRILTTLLFLTSCLSPFEKGVTDIDIKNSIIENEAQPVISNVTLINDQLTVTGSNFSNLNSVKINSNNLSVISNDGSTLVLSAAGSIVLALNTALNLVIENSYGAASVPVTFNLVDDSITSAKIGDKEVKASDLDSMGLTTGQVLQWSGSTWQGVDLSGLAYLGTWDATAPGVGPDAGAGGSPGDYYIVNTSGTVDIDGTNIWTIGDWVIWNGLIWDKIDNSTGVKTFNGRSGTVTPLANDYTWSQIDKTTSSIGDVADVDMTGVAAGKILKWNGSAWVINDDLSNGGAGSVTSSEIQNDSIVDADINASAAIAQSKISGLTTALAGKQATITTGTTTEYLRADLTKATLNTTVVPEGTNEYFTVSRARVATISDAIADTVTTLAPTQNAVFDALALKQNIITNPVTGTGTDNRVSLWNGTTAVDASAITETKLNYLTDVTGNIQAQLDSKLASANEKWDTAIGGINYSAGNVGIGIATPTEKLEIAGNIKVSAPSDICIDGGNCLSQVDSNLMNKETLTLDKTLVAGTNVKFQYLDPNGTSRNITLDTASAYAGALFNIKNNGTDSRYLTIKQGATTLDTIYAGGYSQMIYDGANWVMASPFGGEAGALDENVFLGSGTQAQNAGSALGYRANANSGAAALGYYASAYIKGVSLGYQSHSYNHSVAVGYQAGYGDNKPNGTYTEGDGNVFLGYKAGYSPSLTKDFSNTLIIANDDLDTKTPLIFGKFDTGYIGIGTTTPTEKLEVSGDVKAVDFVYSSDERWKNNFEKIESALELIVNLQGYFYDWRRDEFPDKNFSSKKQIGFSAQEVERIIPEIVVTGSDGFKGVKYSKLAPILVEALKELKKDHGREIASIKIENEKLKSETKAMKEILCEIKPSAKICK